MRAYWEETQQHGIRMQPWTEAEHDPSAKYYNLREHPELTETSLEEFIGLAHYESVQRFFALLRWMNGPDSPYETTDSRMGQPQANGQRDLADKTLVRDGGLIFFFRDLELNLSTDSGRWDRALRRGFVDQDGVKPAVNENLRRFAGHLVDELRTVNTDSLNDCIGIEFMPTLYTEAPVADSMKMGNAFVVRFWLWGDTDDEIMGTFTRTVEALSTCLQKLAPEVLQMRAAHNVMGEE
ncbi:MAG TPA: hypothetical protein VF611_04615 [Pyrinomonadaceae bacterium]|jgi:hypothetical protein